ncbi:MAG: hypothetical protein ACMUEL_06430 [Flavobacteriales bacterium Tduv]
MSSLASNGATTHVVENRKKEQKRKSVKEKKGKKTQSGVDTQGKWLKKLGKLYYGYKKHIGMD